MINPNIKNGQELVLLVDEDVFRPVLIAANQGIATIFERSHLSPDHMHERVWFCMHDERALTGQRIFRELPKPEPREPGEKPLFDELVIKTPLPFWTPPQS